TVGAGAEETASDRSGTFGTALTREQLESLSDDPNELQSQINAMAGPNAVIRVDSFEGQQLPPKSQIKSIRISRDQFAAENHGGDGIFIDIVTQPGVGPMRGGVRLGYQNSVFDGTNPLVGRRGPSENRNFGANIGGTLVQNRAGFSISVNGS